MQDGSRRRGWQGCQPAPRPRTPGQPEAHARTAGSLCQALPPTHLNAQLCQPQVCIVWPQREAELRPCRQHAVRLAGAALVQVVNQDPHVGFAARQDQRLVCRMAQRGGTKVRQVVVNKGTQ